METRRERNINMWLLLAHPSLGTWPATETCAPTGNQTKPLVCRLALNPVSHTSQGHIKKIFKDKAQPWLVWLSGLSVGL